MIVLYKMILITIVIHLGLMSAAAHARNFPQPEYCKDTNLPKLEDNLKKIVGKLGDNASITAPACEKNLKHRERYPASPRPDQTYALGAIGIDQWSNTRVIESACLTTLHRMLAKEKALVKERKNICAIFKAINPSCLTQGQCHANDQNLKKEISVSKRKIAQLLAEYQSELDQASKANRNAATDLAAIGQNLVELINELKRNPQAKKSIPPFGMLPQPGLTINASNISMAIRDLEEKLTEIKGAAREQVELLREVSNPRMGELAIELPKERDTAKRFALAAGVEPPDFGPAGQRRPRSNVTNPDAPEADGPPQAGRQPPPPPSDPNGPTQANQDPPNQEQPESGGGAPDLSALANAMKGLAGGGGGADGNQQPNSQVQGAPPGESDAGLHKMPGAKEDGPRAIDPNAYVKGKQDPKAAAGEFGKNEERDPNRNKSGGSGGNISGDSSLQNGVTARGTPGGPAGANATGASSSGGGGSSLGRSQPPASSGPLADTYESPSDLGSFSGGAGGSGSSGSGYLGKQNLSLDSSSDSESIKKILSDMEKNMDDPLNPGGSKNGNPEQAKIAGFGIADKLKFGSEVINANFGAPTDESTQESITRFGGETTNLFFRMHTCLYKQAKKGQVLNGIPKEI